MDFKYLTIFEIFELFKTLTKFKKFNNILLIFSRSVLNNQFVRTPLRNFFLTSIIQQFHKIH